jgi:hypothetical protein
MNNLLTPVTHGQLKTRINPGPVEALNAFPDVVHHALTDTHKLRLFACSITIGHGGKI